MVARNDITGDLIKSKVTMGKKYEDNFDRIFRKKKPEIQTTEEERIDVIGQNGNIGYTEEEVNE